MWWLSQDLRESDLRRAHRNKIWQIPHVTELVVLLCCSWVTFLIQLKLYQSWAFAGFVDWWQHLTDRLRYRRLAKSQVEVNISLQKSVCWHNECSICRKHPVCVFCAVDLHTQGNLRHWDGCRSTEQAQISRATCLLCSWSLNMWQNQECQKSSNGYSQTGCWIARNPRQAVAYLYFPLIIPLFQQIYKVF